MNSVWWIGLGTVVIGALTSGLLVFNRHGEAPRATRPNGDGTRAVPGVGRRVGSAMLLLVLTLGVAGVIAAAIGAIVFLGGLSLTS